VAAASGYGRHRRRPATLPAALVDRRPVGVQPAGIETKTYRVIALIS
jgi:hypothetical protein